MLRFPFSAKSITRSVPAGLALASLLAPSPSFAQGDLLVAPTRVIINNRGTAEVVLDNIGEKEATYRISVTLKRMTEEGNLEPVEEKDANAVEKAAEGMVRYAPRRVVLPPGQPQSVRISARPPADLPDGEYRIHLAFNGLPPVTPIAAQGSDDKAEGISIRLIPVYSIAIPIIVRKGNLVATAAISNPRIEQGEKGPVFKLDMARSGTASVFGEIRIMHPGNSDPVFLAKGIAVYPEVTHRIFSMALSPEQAAQLKGPVRVEYREFPENGGDLLASVEGTLG